MSIYDQYIRGLMYNGFEKIAMKAEDLYSVYKQSGAKGVSDIINKKKGQINGHAVSKLLSSFNIPEAEVQSILKEIPAKAFKNLTVNSSGNKLPTIPAVAPEPPPQKAPLTSIRVPQSPPIVDAQPKQVSRGVKTGLNFTPAASRFKRPKKLIQWVRRPKSKGKSPGIVDQNAANVQPIIGSNTNTNTSPVNSNVSTSARPVSKRLVAKKSYLPHAAIGAAGLTGLGAYMYYKNKNKEK